MISHRRLFTLLSATSLLICAGLVVAKVWLPDKGYKFYTAFHEYTVSAGPQGFNLMILGGTRMPGGGFGSRDKYWDSAWTGATHRLPLGVWYGRSPADDPTAAFYFQIVVPVWLPISMCLLLPCLWLYRWYFHPFRLPGRCRRCGYGLTANASGVCPECGVAVTVE